VVDAGADDVHLAHGHAQRAGDLAVAVLDAVAEAHGAHARSRGAAQVIMAMGLA
jgi:predicted aspartyl protease